MHIYFLISDHDTVAYERLQGHFDFHADQVKKISDFIDKVGFETDQYWNKGGHIIGFVHDNPNEKIPEGFRENKQSVLVPDNRTKIGKKYKKEMQKLKLPGASEFMERMVGVNAAHVNGKAMISGMGYSYNPRVQYAILNCHLDTWEKAKELEGFNWPEGLNEIKASEYNAHKKDIQAEAE